VGCEELQRRCRIRHARQTPAQHPSRLSAAFPGNSNQLLFAGRAVDFVVTH
jgi:hypothetical protein